jgi:hypothetical protein
MTMGLQRFQIEPLLGVDRNAAEGEATPQPQELQNLHFDRRGGLVAFGGRGRDFSDATIEGDPIAYDESTFILFDNLELWHDGELIDLDASPFNVLPLSLAPRSALLTRWQRESDGSFTGGALVRLPSGEIVTASPATGFTVTPNGGGTDIPTGDYDFIVAIEAPSDHGLVTIAVLYGDYNQVTASTNLELELGAVLPLGWVARFYYRRNEETFDNFATAVSDGENKITALLTTVTPFVSTNDALLNFASGRLEVHNRRTWGRAAARPFTGYFTDALSVTVGGHMLRGAGQALDGASHSGAVASANMPMRESGDDIVLEIAELSVQRTSTSQAIAVDLFRVAQQTLGNRALWAYLTWPPGSANPVLRVSVANGTTTEHRIFEARIVSGFSLGASVGSSLTVTNYRLTIALGTLTQEGATGRLNGGGSVTVERPSGTNVYSGTVTALEDYDSRYRPDNSRMQQSSNSGSSWTTGWTALSFLTDDDTSTIVRVFREEDTEGATKPVVELHAFGGQFAAPTFVAQVRVTASLSGGAGGLRVMADGPDGVSELGSATASLNTTLDVDRLVTRIWVEAYTFNTGQGIDLRCSRLIPFGSRTSSFGAWTDYSTAAASDLHLGSMPSAFAGGKTRGDRVMHAERLVAFRGATELARGDILDYVTGTSWTSSSPNAETWTTTSAELMAAIFRDFVPGDDVTFPQPNLVLIYSETGSVNRGTFDNYITLSPSSSTRITALSSTPAGLVVFCEHEAFLVRGDPALDLEVQRLSGTIGCDQGVIPARLGSVVFPVYRGEVYAISLGMGDVDFGSGMENISRPIWRPDDPVVQVVGESQTNQLVARTAQGHVYRFDAGQWFNDPFDMVEGLRHVSPGNLDPAYGTRYLLGETMEAMDWSLADPVRVIWEDLDLGDKMQEKLWRRIEVVTNTDYQGVPRLVYTIRRQQGLVSTPIILEDDDPEAFEPLALEGNETALGTELNDVLVATPVGDGRWVFSMRRGQVGAIATFRLELPNFTRQDVLEAPLIIEVAQRNRPRGRVVTVG